jgi:hypothetical protein
MDIANMSKGLGANEIIQDKFNNFNSNNYDMNAFSNLSILMNLIDMLEKDILNIKEIKHKLRFYYTYKKDSKTLEKEKNVQLELKKKIKILEKKFNFVISDIENLRELKEKIKSMIENRKNKEDKEKSNNESLIEIKKLHDESMIIRQNINREYSNNNIIDEKDIKFIEKKEIDDDNYNDNYNDNYKGNIEEEKDMDNKSKCSKNDKVKYCDDDIIEEEKSGVLNKSEKDKSEEIAILKNENSRDIDNLEREIDEVNAELELREHNDLKNSFKSGKV